MNYYGEKQGVAATQSRVEISALIAFSDVTHLVL